MQQRHETLVGPAATTTKRNPKQLMLKPPGTRHIDGVDWSAGGLENEPWPHKS